MEEEKNILTLTDENGNAIDYELLDIVPLNKNIYGVFYPTVPNDTEVVILRIEDTDNPNKSKYIVEQDEFILKKVYAIFKEKYKDEIKFKDE